MDARISTKAFPVVAPVEKSNGANTLTAAEKGELGAENIGEVANRLSDPNWIDPSKKVRAVGNSNLDKDAFMKLMLSQMKNQDPTNPLKSHEMAAQLASFSTLEQMQNVNTTLTDIKNMQKPTENFQALGFIGKSVSGDSAEIMHAKGDAEHKINFTLYDSARTANIHIYNEEGEEVRTITVNNMKKGEQAVTWNSKDGKGFDVPPGGYQFKVDAENPQGKKIFVKTDFDGLITGVNFSPKGTVLLVGDQSVKLRDVKAIREPGAVKTLAAGESAEKVDASPKNNDQKINQDLLEVEKSDQNQVKRKNNMEAVAMSRPVLDQVKKVNGNTK